METYLICGNHSCRMVLDLNGSANSLRRSQIHLSACPECGSEWMSTCPFCVQPLRVMFRGHHAHCGHCHRKFHARAA